MPSATRGLYPYVREIATSSTLPYPQSTGFDSGAASLARNAQAYEAQIGAHIDYIPNKHVILRAGYRFGRAVGSNSDPFKEHRFLTEQTLRKLLQGDLLLSDRNREDFRFVNGDFSFR
jgi:hypothetical protein